MDSWTLSFSPSTKTLVVCVVKSWASVVLGQVGIVKSLLRFRSFYRWLQPLGRWNSTSAFIGQANKSTVGYQSQVGNGSGRFSEQYVLFSKVGVPNLQDLIPDDLRWSWCNNKRNKAHNKCNALESSPNHPLPPQDVEKLSTTRSVPDTG